jgi:hypothetical protein
VKASGLALLGIVETIGIVAEHCEGDDDYNLFKEKLIARIPKISIPLGNISLDQDVPSSSASSGAAAALPPFDSSSLVRFFINLFCIVSVTISQAPPSAIKHHQTPSYSLHQAPPSAIKRHQAPSGAIKRLQAPSSAIKRHQAPPSATKRLQAPLSAIKRHHAASRATKHHQAPPTTIKCHQATQPKGSI